MLQIFHIHLTSLLPPLLQDCFDSNADLDGLLAMGLDHAIPPEVMSIFAAACSDAAIAADSTSHIALGLRFLGDSPDWDVTDAETLHAVRAAIEHLQTRPPNAGPGVPPGEDLPHDFSLQALSPRSAEGPRGFVALFPVSPDLSTEDLAAFGKRWIAPLTRLTSFPVTFAEETAPAFSLCGAFSLGASVLDIVRYHRTFCRPRANDVFALLAARGDCGSTLGPGPWSGLGPAALFLQDGFNLGCDQGLPQVCLTSPHLLPRPLRRPPPPPTIYLDRQLLFLLPPAPSHRTLLLSLA